MNRAPAPISQERYPLSPLQHGMLIHALATPGSGVDIEQMVCTLREEVDAIALRAAWQRVAARHSILRTAFRWDEGAVQEVRASVEIPWREEDWRTLAESERDDRLAAFLREDRRREFIMNEAPLMRLTLFVFAAGDHRLVWTFHHALLDGRSFPIALREVFADYDGRPLDGPLPRPYREYIEWLGAQAPDRSEAFWREKLRGFTTPTPLAVEGLPGCALEASPSDREILLPIAPLRALAERCGVTLNTVVQGAWALLLSRYAGEEDVVFGGTRACRRSTIEGADEMVGCFINTLPVRVRVEKSAALVPWLQELRAQWIELREHEHTSLASVEAWSDVASGRRLFDSLVVFERYELNEVLRVDGGNWSTRQFRLHEQTSFGLTLAAYADADLRLRVQFNRQRFDDATIERLLGHLRIILESFVANPSQRLGDMPLLTNSEWDKLTWRAPGATLRPGALLHELFAAQAARTPDAIALVCDGATVSYAQLDARASALAGHLGSMSVGPETIVGLCLERSNELILAILAILKAGGAYLPIDLAYPPERIAFMLEDAQAPILLTKRHLAAQLPTHGARIVCIEELPEAPPRSALHVPHSASPLLAYVIYTSGSTGQPKGCCITHANVTRLFATTDAWFNFGPGDVWTMFHSVAFDFSVWEIWGALLHGGKLVVVPHAVSRSPDAFLELLVREKVTILNQTPSAFRQLIAADLNAEAQRTQNGAKNEEIHNSPRSSAFSAPLRLKGALRLVIFGGEALEMRSLAQWFERHGDQHPQLVNMYGITETTVHVTYRPLSASDLGAGSVIGVPLPDLQLHILDPALRPVPIGVPGEMFVGGAGVARGYLRRPELTTERFIENPFAPGERLYRTGDLARRLPDGDIEYLGRCDQQIKLRGHRIELGEIEARLREVPGVRDAAVLLREDTPGDQRLAAYVVTPALDSTVMREFLRERLPAYMIPAGFVRLDRLPLTAHGKLDRRALPPPFLNEAAPAEAATTLERRIADVWKAVLQVAHVGLDQTFFDLGGHSLLMVQLHGKLRAELGVDLPITKLFQFPTVRALAHHLAEMDEAALATTTSDRASRQRAAFARQRDLAQR